MLEFYSVFSQFLLTWNHRQLKNFCFIVFIRQIKSVKIFIVFKRTPCTLELYINLSLVNDRIFEKYWKYNRFSWFWYPDCGRIYDTRRLYGIIWIFYNYQSNFIDDQFDLNVGHCIWKSVCCHGKKSCSTSLIFDLLCLKLSEILFIGIIETYLL